VLVPRKRGLARPGGARHLLFFGCELRQCFCIGKIATDIVFGALHSLHTLDVAIIAITATCRLLATLVSCWPPPLYFMRSSRTLYLG
jgi:hypothetical protein